MSRRLPALLALLILPGGLAAQEPDTLGVDSLLPVPRVEPAIEPVVQDAGALPVSPGGAMIRSMILPGWGQAPFDAYFRGGVYFAGWAGNWFMLFRNSYRLENARTRFDIRAEQIEEGLITAAPNPDSMRAQIDSFPTILIDAIREDSLGNDLRKLVRAREQQREDWIAWSLFWLLASGIDAFVTAHLHEFPADVELRPAAAAGGRAISVSISVPVPGIGARQPRPAPAALPAPPLPDSR